MYRIRSIGLPTTVAFIAALMVIAIGGWQILRTRDAILRDAEQNAGSLARSLAQHAARTVDAADLALMDAVEQVESGGSKTSLPAYLSRRDALLAQARNFIVVDQAGKRVATSAPAHRVSRSINGDDFLWQRDHLDPGLHISPMTVGPESGLRGIPISRRIQARDGSFAGVAAAMLSPEYYEAFYKSLNAGPRSAFGLWLDDGRLLLRYSAVQQTATAQDPAHQTSTSSRFSRMSGVTRGHSFWDGVERLFAFEHVDGLPLVVSAAVAVDDVLTDWRRDALIEAFVVCGAAVVLVCLGLGLEIHRRRIQALDAATRAADRQYRLLADNSHDLIVLKPVFEGFRSYVSPSSKAVVGWDPDELATMPAAMFLHPEDFAAVRADFAALTPGAPVRTVQARARHKAGHYIWLETLMRRMDDGRVLLSARDITARRKAEIALADSESRFRSLTDASSDVIQMLGLDGCRRYVSPAAREVLGHAPENLIGTRAVERVHPEDHARVTTLIDDLRTGRSERARSVHRVQHASGIWRWVDVHFRLVRDRGIGAPREIVSSLRDVDEREAMRHQLETANRLLRSAEGIAQVGHWRYDLETETLAWSEEAFRIYGLDPRSFAPTIAAAVAAYHPDDRSLVQNQIDTVMRKRKSSEVAARLVRPDGETRHVLARSLCETNASGSVVAIFGTLMDVTEPRRAERAAVESEARYRLLADHTTDMISHMDPTGRQLFVSPGSRGLLGYEPEALTGTNPLDSAHPDDAAELRRVFTHLLSGQSAEVSHSFRTRHRDGRWIWVEANLKLIRDGAGAPAGCVGSVRNIMDRKLADEALRTSEARYRIMAEATSDFITQLDLSMHRQYVSPACRHVLGYEPEELLGLRPSNMIHPDDADEVRALAASLMRGEVAGGRAAATYRMRHKDGRWLWMEAGLNLVRDEATGAPISLICSARDVTERQRLARHMQRAKEVAEEAVRVKSDFVANMSHELRTPLTGILGVHDLLKRDPALGGAQRRLVELASEAGTSLLAIVNDVLDLSKIEAGQLSLESVPFELDDLMAGCRNLANRGIKSKALEIRTVLPPDMPHRLLGDPTRLRQILLNLLTNAVKFTEEGEIVATAAYRSETGLLRLDVTDTGIGIPAERAADLFERFTQGDTSMSRRYGGTGLGLAICKRLAVLMGGRIGVLPATGGAHFWVELPLKALDGPLTEPAEKILPSPGRGAGRHLLLAEDNAVNAEIIATMLQAQNYRVTSVINGALAAELIAGGTDVDLILMDLQMPVMDGFAATIAIREREIAQAARRVPIIGLTANAFAEDATRCLAAGMDGHVAKPIVWSTLFSSVDKCLEQADARLQRLAS